MNILTLEELDKITLKLCGEYPWLDFSFQDDYSEELRLLIREARITVGKKAIREVCTECKGSGLRDEHYVQERHEHTGRKIPCYICGGTGFKAQLAKAHKDISDEDVAVSVGVLEALVSRLDADKDLAEIKAIGYALIVLKHRDIPDGETLEAKEVRSENKML